MTTQKVRPRPVVLALISVCLGGVLPTGFTDAANTADLLQAAAAGNAEARYQAIDQLGHRHQAAETVVPALEKLLKDSDPKIRWRTARALGEYGRQAKSAAADVRKLLTDSDPVVQYHAAHALGKMGDKSDATVDALVALVASPDDRAARAAITSLRALSPDPKHVVEVLDNILQSNDHAVVAHAIEAATEQGVEAVPMLNEALKRPRTAYIACAAIEHIGPDAADTVPALAALLEETKHSHLLIQAALALASIGPPAQSTSPQLIGLLEHADDATIPVAAAYALGSIGAADADQPLRAAMSKSNPMLQMVAAWALAKIHPQDEQLRHQAIEKLQTGLKSDDPAMQAAAEKGIRLLGPSTKGRNE